MDNSIGLLLKGGLGNQLFQIFTLISKAIDTNKDFYILHDNRDKRPLYSFLFKSIIDKIQINYYNISNNPDVYNEEIGRVYKRIPDNAIFINGYFESPLYFNHNKNKIIDILQLNQMQFKYKFDFKKIICIHFRFEDILYNTEYIEKPIYFINALNVLKDEIKDDFYNYNFVIFSTRGEKDDILTDIYIKEINEGLETPINFIKFTQLYPNTTTEEEFIYMSNCDYFIISSSTFSWFAYYISPFENKKIIMSEVWREAKKDLELYNLNGVIKIPSFTFKSNEVLDFYKI